MIRWFPPPKTSPRLDAWDVAFLVLIAGSALAAAGIVALSCVL